MLLAVLSGCVPQPSLQPLYTEDTVVFEPALVGTWSTESGEETVVIEAGEENTYRLIYIVDDKFHEGVSVYEVHAVRVGDRLYLDLVPDDSYYDPLFEENAYLPMIPAHFFCQVELRDDALYLAQVDDDWVKKQIRENRVTLPHAVYDNDEIVLTATPEELQEFLKNNPTGQTPGDGDALHRIPDEVGQVRAARVFAERNREDLAEAAYTRAVEINPHYGEAYQELGNLRATQGRHREALAAYLKAAEFISDDAELRQRIAATYETIARESFCGTTP